MAKIQKVIQEVIQVLEVQSFEGLKSFEATGVSRHMPKGSFYELNEEQANFFLKLGYIK